jgi:DNA repair exonuclease SbcCD ATPase subunit
MRPRKSKLSIDLNKPVTEEEQGLKNGRKVKTLIKPKVEADREMDDNHQVQALKQQNDDMRQQIQSLQQQKQDLELQHNKLQKKYQKLQKKHQKTCMFLKEII